MRRPQGPAHAQRLGDICLCVTTRVLCRLGPSGVCTTSCHPRGRSCRAEPRFSTDFERQQAAQAALDAHGPAPQHTQSAASIYRAAIEPSAVLPPDADVAPRHDADRRSSGTVIDVAHRSVDDDAAVPAQHTRPRQPDGSFQLPARVDSATPVARPVRPLLTPRASVPCKSCSADPLTVQHSAGGAI